MIETISKSEFIKRLALVHAELVGLKSALGSILTKAGIAYASNLDTRAEILRDLANELHDELMPSIKARFTDLEQRLAEYDEVNPVDNATNQEESNT